MDAFLTVTLMTLIAGVGGTGLGGILGALVRTESNRIVSLLLSATSGVMISIVCFELMVESLEAVINKARNDGYRDAMTYLDDRATTARESGAREERARIANMGFFERRRYLNIHVA